MSIDNSNPTVDLDIPVDVVRTAEEDHELEGRDHDPEVTHHPHPETGDMTCDITYECSDCDSYGGWSTTAVYLLRYTERKSDGTSFRRDEPPKCDCPESDSNGNMFDVVEYRMINEDTIIVFGECNWCGTRFEDMYKFEHYR